jgi:lipopolysaccharide/colanic/teichoic acid biosynthesis glycosyltransferase/glycosyltransferase involved in cell wall biosynthesis
VSAPGAALDEFARREGATPWTVPFSRRPGPREAVLVLGRLWRLFRRLRPDMVHAHTPQAGLLGMLAARLAGVPARFYTLHGLAWETTRGWRRGLLRALDRLACGLATQVLAVSPSVRAAALGARLASPAKILVPAQGSANGLDFERFDPARIGAEDLRSRYGLPEGAPVVGWVGRLVPDKGVADLVAVWSELRERFPSLYLLLLGETEPHDPLPPRLWEALRDDPRVRRAGWTQDMPAHYRLLDVVLLTSRREGLPYAALEAAAMEIPVAAFAATGVVDIIEDGATGLLVPPGDSAALAAAAARLLTLPALARRLGREARRRAVSRYRPEPLWAAIHQSYLEALDAPRVRRGKRILDATGAAVALALLAPLLGLVAVAVRLRLGAPVLFRQRRTGWREQPFEILKFRTMRDGPAGASDTARLTRLGRVLRRTSLDELPQLWNILRGEMSFIGPRPLLERYLGFYTARERRRHRVRGGLTGWAQIHGRNDVAWSERLELDAWYADHISGGLDLRIAGSTLRQMLRGAGVRDDPRAVRLDLDQERQQA